MTPRLEVHEISEAVDAQAARWRSGMLMHRLWSADPSVWGEPGTPELADRLGWLTLPSTSRDLVPIIHDLAAEAKRSGIRDIVLCGMGGSSLAPEVFADALTESGSNPVLTVLDSTHPDAVAAVDDATSPDTTWYVISSKSGGTLETLSFFRWFWARTSREISSPGSHFIAITDPGSPLAGLAHERHFKTVVNADPTVGGRYSALTAFGLIPSGLAGADPTRLLDNAAAAATACGPDIDLLENPAFLLGATMATRAISGVDKAHMVADGSLSSLPLWAEQLIAESTGKSGKGIIPIDGGPFPSAATDGFVITIDAAESGDADVVLTTDDRYDIAGAMFIFELATAIAGEILGIHPFNQPDVEIAKRLAATAMAGELADTAQPPIRIGDEALDGALSSLLTDHQPSYVSFQAYLAPNPTTDAALESLRELVDAHLAVYTTAGYGPRFLHSTGQIHKGGPPGGVFIQILDDPDATMRVPETDFTFGELIAAQAEGDRAALTDRGRRVVAVDLGADTATGLESLLEVVRTALR